MKTITTGNENISDYESIWFRLQAEIVTLT